MRSIKAISFDAVGTLFHLRRTVGEVYAEAALSSGVKIRAEEATEAFRDLWSSARNRPDTKRLEDDRGFWRTLVAGVLERCGVSSDAVLAEAIFKKAYDEYRGAAEWTLYPETLEVLTALAKRWPLLIISNYDGRLHGTLDALGLRRFFAAVIVSSEVGREKPSARIFQQAAATMACRPDELWHVGDERQADFEGAQAAGLGAWLLERPQMNLQDFARLAALDFS